VHWMYPVCDDVSGHGDRCVPDSEKETVGLEAPQATRNVTATVPKEGC